MTLQELRDDLLQTRAVRRKEWVEGFELRWSYTFGWMFSSDRGTTWIETSHQPDPLNMFKDDWELVS